MKCWKKKFGIKNKKFEGGLRAYLLAIIDENGTLDCRERR